MYHLPLLPGYGPGVNIRSSVAAVTTTGKSFLAHLSEAEENGYQGTYFTSQASHSPTYLREGYISSSSPVASHNQHRTAPSPLVLDHPFDEHTLTPASEILPIKITTTAPDVDPGTETDPGVYNKWKPADDPQDPEIAPKRNSNEDVAEVVFFGFGVVVFFGLEERHERDILEDIANASIVRRPIDEDDWEIEECHYAVCFFF
jgi:uncharacterized Rmd1/YagE family protein